MRLLGTRFAARCIILVLLLSCALWAWVVAITDLPSISRVISGNILLYEVKPGDSLEGLSSRFGVNLLRLTAKNELSKNKPLRPKQVLSIDTRHIAPQVGEDGIVINIPQRMLFLFRSGKLVSSYPVGLGRPTWPTAAGNFTIMAKEKDPVWDVPESIQEEMRQQGKPVLKRVPPGPDNPLGKYFLRISPSLGIHGTIAPLSIYRFQTHGCIRLHPEDIADLFQRVGVGTPVRIVYEPMLLAQSNDKILFLEANRDIYGRVPKAMDQIRVLTQNAKIADLIDWDMAEEVLRRREGAPIDVTRLGSSVSRIRTAKDVFHAVSAALP